jgi:hypothetical protein
MTAFGYKVMWKQVILFLRICFHTKCDEIQYNTSGVEHVEHRWGKLELYGNMVV